MKPMVYATLLCLTLAGCGEKTKKTDFVNKATYAGEFEIKSSELAEQKSTNAEVKAFAQMMIVDHTAAAKKLQAVAAGAGVQADKGKVSPHTADMADLEKAKPEDFDAENVEKQREAHEEAVSLFRGYAEDGDDPQLKQFAAETLPALEKHLEHVKGINVRN